MKKFLFPLLASLVLTAAACFANVEKIAPADAARLVAEGHAVLVDVRESAEWTSTGVAAPAVLLARSDFDGEQKDWKPFLEKHRTDTLILYCRSGNRSNIVGAALTKAGYKVLNAGGFAAWQSAGLPTRQP